MGVIHHRHHLILCPFSIKSIPKHANLRIYAQYPFFENYSHSRSIVYLFSQCRHNRLKFKIEAKNRLVDCLMAGWLFVCIRDWSILCANISMLFNEFAFSSVMCCVYAKYSDVHKYCFDNVFGECEQIHQNIQMDYGM